MDEETYFIDYSVGNGANDETEDYSDSTAVVENDGRSKTRTGFDARDAGNSREVVRDGETLDYWNWLNQLNDGRKASDIESRKRRANAKRDALTFASQLGMTSFQKERISHIIQRLDTLHTEGGAPVEATVLALISLVANEDDWRIRREPLTTVEYEDEDGTWKKDVPLFVKIQHDVGVSPQMIRRLRKKLRSEL